MTVLGRRDNFAVQLDSLRLSTSDLKQERVTGTEGSMDAYSLRHSHLISHPSTYVECMEKFSCERQGSGSFRRLTRTPRPCRHSNPCIYRVLRTNTYPMATFKNFLLRSGQHPSLVWNHTLVAGGWQVTMKYSHRRFNVVCRNIRCTSRFPSPLMFGTKRWQ